MSENEKNENNKNEPENKRKPHEKHIVGRAHFNNLDLSKFAKHDWKAEHEAHVKAAVAARAKKAAEGGLRTPPASMTVRVYFQTLDRVGDEEGELLPANDPVFDSDPLAAVPIMIDGNLNYVDYEIPSNKIEHFSALDLLEALEMDFYEIFTEITFKHIDTPLPTDYVENITINEDSEPVPYPTTPDDEGYTPVPDEMIDGEIADWFGNSWMFFDPHTDDEEKDRWDWNDGSNTLVPEWDPDDNKDWDPNDPDGDDGYPNGTLNEYEPLWQLLTYNEDNGKYEIMFSFETLHFAFVYEQQVIDGVAKWVMVIRPLRRKKKK